MAYRLQKRETLAAGLKRVAEEQVSEAIKQLESPNDLKDRIYQARKCLKKARAILRLLAPQLGPLSKEESRRLRDVGRRFSALRDAQVSAQLLEEFAKYYKRHTALNPHRFVLAQKQSELEQGSDWHAVLSESVGLLSATRKRIEDWPLSELNQKSVDDEIQKTHKHSHKTFEHARQTRSPEDFHEFRKAVKRELNQARLFESEGRHIDMLKHLSDLLGQHHNHAVLMQHVENPSERFRAMVRRRLRNLETQILSAGAAMHDVQQKSAVA